MTDRNILALNKAAQTLMDSQQGYRSGAVIANDHFLKDHPKRADAGIAMSERFHRRATERRALIRDIQNQLRAYGEMPQGHNGDQSGVDDDFALFSKLINKDERAALSAIDNSEESLAVDIRGLLNEYSRMSQSTKRLLRKAYKDAKSRQRLGMME